MRVKLVLPLFLCGLLTGCDKVIKPLMLGGVSSTVVRHDVALVIGQSNNARFEQYGEGAFAKDYQRFFPGSTIQFINCSVGGTAINQWQVDGPEMAACRFNGLKPTLILFYQGEADAYLKTGNWNEQFVSAVLGWRKLLGELPVVYAQIAVEDPTLYCPQTDWDALQFQQTCVGLHNVRMIKTSDVSQLDPDPAIAQGVHLSPQSYVNIAERYVEGLAQIINPE